MTFTSDLYKVATGKAGLVTAVTAFVPIPGHPRSEEEYRELGSRLLSMETRIPLLSAEASLDQCWLYQQLVEDFPDGGFTHSVSDNPQKNSLAYHCVQAQKFAWLEAASELDPLADVFVWIDYGILHVPGVTPRIIETFLERAKNEQAIAIPGCWDEDYVYDDGHPCWRFCGGVMVVPRQYVWKLAAAMRSEYTHWLATKQNISWEVNALARYERAQHHFRPQYEHTKLPLWWYKADHDETMFTNYQATENADRAYTSTGISRRELWQT